MSFCGTEGWVDLAWRECASHRVGRRASREAWAICRIEL